jgi:pimeloyl-ACP methyl ester carboxylesterase
VGVAQFVSAAGVRLAYDAAGAGDPPMIFVHGWCGDRSSFSAQVAHFGGGHAVVAMDLRGHGDSSRPDPEPGAYDIEVLAGDVLELAAAAGLDAPILVGHSLGALIGLVCAARPGAIRALVMIDPAPITNEPVKAYFRETVEIARADADRSWRTAFVSGMFLPTDVVRREAIIAGSAAVAPPVAAAVLRAMGEFDGAGTLSRATVPMLSVGSAAPVNAPDDLRGARPEIMIGQTVGAGHFCHLEVPDQVNPMIERFLAISGLPARP